MTSTRHRDIQEDFAGHLRKKRRPPVVFIEIALAGAYGRQGRLDVVSFTSARKYKVISLKGYEVKASRSDLLGDLKAGKWRKYLPYVTQFYFIIAEGIATPDEIPEECGVIVALDRGGFYFPRKAPMQDQSNVDTKVLARLIWRADGYAEEERKKLREAKFSYDLQIRSLQEEIDSAELRQAQLLDTVADGSVGMVRGT